MSPVSVSDSIPSIVCIATSTKKCYTTRVMGLRVLTSTQGFTILREKEENKMKEQQEKKERREIRLKRKKKRKNWQKRKLKRRQKSTTSTEAVQMVW